MSAFDKYVNEMNSMLNERSINKIQSEFNDTVNKMAAMAKEYAAATGDEKTNILAELKGLTTKKNALVKELEAAVAGKDKDVQLAITEGTFTNENKGFRNTKNFIDFLEEIDGMPEFAIKKIMGKEYIDTPGGWSDEKDDYDNIEDYMISNMGRKEFERLQDWWEANVAESITNEAKIILKRQYTEKYPASTVGHFATVRNKVLEAIKDGKISIEQFEKIVSDFSNNSKRWTKNNAQYFTITEDGVTLSEIGKKVLSGITLNEASYKEFPKGYNPQIWVPSEFEKDISKYSNSKLNRKIVLDAAKKWSVDPKDAIDYVEFGWNVDLSENKNNNNMKTKFVYESFQEFINEKAYQLSGIYGAKGIAGKVLFAFKKEVERVKYEGDAEETLKDINKAWLKWADTAGAKIIEAEVMKQVKDKEAIVYVTSTLGGYEWTTDTVNGVNNPTRPELLVRFPGDFVINVGFADDVDGDKFSRKLGGMLNNALYSSTDTEVVGNFDAEVAYNNIEIRSGLFLTIDAK